MAQRKSNPNEATIEAGDLKEMAKKTGVVGEDKEEDFLQTVRERYLLCYEADRENRERAKEALDFRNLIQWDERTRNERETDPEGARPCLVVDKLNQHVMQVVNDERQNRPQIKARPVDDFGDVETAKIFDGIIRHIQDRSRADVAYDTAFEAAVDGGFGFWRLLTQYTDPMSFEQDIVIKRGRNRFQFYLDPARQEPDGSDANYGFILYKVQKKDFKKEFGKEANEALQSFLYEGKEFTEWYGDDWVIYAEYFWKEKKKETIVLLKDGSIRVKTKEDTDFQMERETEIVTVRWRKVTATKILTDGEWVGDSIPIYEVVGNELDIEGKTYRSGLIRPAMDAQRVDNYATSAFVENVALAPRASYVAAEGQIESHADLWKTANRRNISVLPYNPISVDGIIVPPPRREPPPGVSTGWLSVMEQSQHNIQAAMGRYNATLGAPSNETSGKAISARNREGDTGSFHFSDNLTRSLRRTGQDIVNIIPKIYDTKRIARIIGEDGELGQATVDPNLADEAGNPIAYQERTLENGKIEKIYNLGVGKYDVTIIAGPSYTTRRLESSEAMMEISRSNKEFLMQFGDIIFKAQDWPGAEKISDRFRKMLPPELKEEETDIEAQSGQIKQAAEMLGQKEAELNQTAQDIEEQSQQVVQQKEEAEKALLKVKDEVNKLNDIMTGIENERALLDLQKKLAEKELELKSLTLQSEKDIAESEMETLKTNMNAKLREINDAAQATEVDTARREEIGATNQSVLETLSEVIKLVSAPRTTQLVLDKQGNPTGSVSQVIQ